MNSKRVSRLPARMNCLVGKSTPGDAREFNLHLQCCNDFKAHQPSEIIFNPIVQWPRRGPFTKLFRRFLWSPIPPQAKWSILGYMCSYYAIALACTATILNFVLIGIFGE